MEPNLIRKYLAYRRKQDKGGIKPSKNMNDSGVSIKDMQSNDLWSIVFLLLLTHDPRFAFCYTYKNDNKDGAPIKFDDKVFKKLFPKVIRKYEEDQNFCYVLKKLSGYKRFEKDEFSLEDSQVLKEIYKPVIHSKRDIKFYIWLLTYGRYPEKKIENYEDGEQLREIDECRTLGSNQSLYNSQQSEEALESEVKQYMTGKQILENLDKKKIKKEKIEKFEPSLYTEPGYSFFEQKSYLQKQEISKKKIPSKVPIQKIEGIPLFSYKTSNIKEKNNEIIYDFNNKERSNLQSKTIEGYSHISVDKVTKTHIMKPTKQLKKKKK